MITNSMLLVLQITCSFSVYVTEGSQHRTRVIEFMKKYQICGKKFLVQRFLIRQINISYILFLNINYLLEEADIVCCTLSGAGSPPLLEFARDTKPSKFVAVIIDEAAQAVEPSTLIPLKYCPQTVVLVGDPSQLPSTVFSPIAKNENYGQSLFQVQTCIFDKFLKNNLLWFYQINY
jgi:hypothetical protein